MIRIVLSESIFAEIGQANEVYLNISESDLNTMIVIAKNNKMDIAILNTEEK